MCGAFTIKTIQPKRTWKQVDGVLLLDKPLGMTSNDAVQKVRRLFSAAKAGHTGTLDPLATGLLPLCFGEATKFSADLFEADKTYVARVKFGVTTDSGDAEGQIIDRRAVNFDAQQLQAMLARFTGPIQQIPPMHSALKRDGRPLYELARQGIEVDRPARDVTIHALELLECAGDEAVLRVACSKGTYIRTLAMDLGDALDCGAHLIGLRRVEVGRLSLTQAATLQFLQDLPEEERVNYLQPVDALLQDLPRVELSEPESGRFMHGNAVAAPEGINGRCRVYSQNALLGLGEVRADARLWPKRLVQPHA